MGLKAVCKRFLKNKPLWLRIFFWKILKHHVYSSDVSLRNIPKKSTFALLKVLWKIFLKNLRVQVIWRSFSQNARFWLWRFFEKYSKKTRLWLRRSLKKSWNTHLRTFTNPFKNILIKTTFVPLKDPRLWFWKSFGKYS